jgi:two-component system CheB/CheR fusion protein
VLRIWSAGCATGEEAYSLAILVAEILGDELEDFNVRIFATDLDADAIAFARRGIYPPPVMSGVPTDLVEKYFSRINGDYEANKNIRNLIVFGQHDLGQRAPFPQVDLVVCRNVLIYFTPELQLRALQLFAFSLRAGARLVLGKSETTTPLADLFATENQQLKIYRRQGGDVLIPAPRSGAIWRQRTGSVSGRRTPASAAATSTPGPNLGGLVDGERAEQLLMAVPIGIAVVDRHYDIQFINATARQLLGIHGPAIGDDLIHATRTIPTQGLRRAIDEAFRTRASTSAQGVVAAETAAGDSRYVEIHCQPVWPSGAERAEPTTVELAIIDVTAPTAVRQNPRGGGRRTPAKRRADQLPDGANPSPPTRSSCRRTAI